MLLEHTRSYLNSLMKSERQSMPETYGLSRLDLERIFVSTKKSTLLVASTESMKRALIYKKKVPTNGNLTEQWLCLC
jgi:hypothetical protein